jgi:poly-gamma-glutamate synthesis protein (capsule biosynthesis protein)
MALVNGGFNVLSVANNHIMDYGVRGLEFTKSFLSKANIQHVGAGLDIEKARHPVIIRKRGMSVGFIAYAKNGKHSAGDNLPGAVPINRSIIAVDIQRLKTKVDFIVVSLHFGMIYTDYPVPEDQDLSRFIIQQGANVVIGHHPHVLQGVEYFEHGVILYSLGEFIFDPTVGNIYSPVARDIRCESLIAEIILENRNASLNLIPVILNNDYCPRICHGKDAEVILNRVESLSVSLSTRKYDFYKHASSRTIRHNLTLFWFHVRRFNWEYVLLKLLRIRMVHLKILFSYIRNLLHL